MIEMVGLHFFCFRHDFSIKVTFQRKRYKSCKLNHRDRSECIFQQGHDRVEGGGGGCQCSQQIILLGTRILERCEKNYCEVTIQKNHFLQITLGCSWADSYHHFQSRGRGAAVHLLCTSFNENQINFFKHSISL